MVRYRRGIGQFDPLRDRIWLEIAGQRRLQRLQRNLKARRELIERWATAIDDLEERIQERLDDSGGSRDYDTTARDVSAVHPKGVRHRRFADAARRRARHTSGSRAHLVADDELDDDYEDERVERKPAIETYYDDGQWKSRRQGSKRALSVGGTKASQVADGREAARRDHTEHIIKNRDGRIAERNSYGPDPDSSEG